jgi:hypothetical protein
MPLCIFAFLSVSCAAGPALLTTISCTGNELAFTVSGKQLPVMKRLSLTFAYDPSATSLANATVSSPVPSTALSAQLDTAARQLVLSIVAASSVAVADGATVTVIHARLTPGAAPGNAVSLVAALCIDGSGNEIAPAIGPASVRQPFLTRTRVSRVGGTGIPAALVTLDGRIYGATAHGAAGVGIGDNGVRVFFHGAAERRRSPGRD